MDPEKRAEATESGYDDRVPSRAPPFPGSSDPYANTRVRQPFRTPSEFIHVVVARAILPYPENKTLSIQGDAWDNFFGRVDPSVTGGGLATRNSGRTTTTYSTSNEYSQTQSFFGTTTSYKTTETITRTSEEPASEEPLKPLECWSVFYSPLFVKTIFANPHGWVAFARSLSRCAVPL
jgi:hypothetical protein